MKIIEDMIEQFKFNKIKELEKREEIYKSGKDVADSFLTLRKEYREIILEKSKNISVYLDRDYRSTVETLCIAVIKSNNGGIEIMESIGYSFEPEEFRSILDDPDNDLEESDIGMILYRIYQNVIIKKIKDTLWKN